MEPYLSRPTNFVLALALALGATACATPPVEIEQARKAYDTAAADPELSSYAAVELYEVSKTLDEAEGAWDVQRDPEEGKHLAYVATRQIEVAREAARRKKAEDELARLTQERERVVLEARTREADVARAIAEVRAREAEEAARLARAAQARAEELQREIDELGARRSERGLVLTLGDVLFDTDSAALRAGTVRNLEVLKQFLAENPDRSVIIEGHTDSTGTPDYNASLSQRRANSVAAFLRESGIPSERIVAVGYGQDFPVASNQSGVGRQQNRRVDVVILDAGVAPSERMRTPSVAAPGPR